MRNYAASKLPDSDFLFSSGYTRRFVMSQPFGSNPDFNNPFSAPGTSFSPGSQPASKPTAANVFGILNLVFGGLGLLGQGISFAAIYLFREKLEEITKQPIPQPGTLQLTGIGVTVLLTFWLLYSGFRVLGGTMAGRAAFMQYCIGSLLIRPIIIGINLFAQYEQLQQQMQAGGPAMPPAVMLGIFAVGGLFGIVWAEVYEAIGFFFMRSKGITQQFEAWDNVVNNRQPNQSFNFQ